MSSPPPSPAEQSTDVGYETSDVRPRTIIWFGVAIILSAAIVCLGLWVLLAQFEHQAAKTDAPPSPLVTSQPDRPQPRLQSAPYQDYDSFRQSEERRLNSYGWVDNQQRTVHIPISRAIDLLLERGFPDIPVESSSEKPLQEQAK